MAMVGLCISYPKSGRTWLRRMLEVAGFPRALRFHHDGFEFNEGACPQHDFSFGARLERYPPDAKVIYLDRDPRDVMVSLCHQVTGRFRDIFGYEHDISTFIRDDYFGAHTLARFRELWAHVLSQRDFLAISYEGLHADSGAVLRRVLAYLDLTAAEADIAAAVEAGKFENMRRVEQSGEHPEPWLRLRQGHPKVRRGEIGGFGQELTAEDISYLDGVFGRRQPGERHAAHERGGTGDVRTEA